MNCPSDDKFDQLTKEFAKENTSAYASNRTETQEEANLKKQKELEKETSAKQKRMVAFSDEEDDADDSSGTTSTKTHNAFMNSMLKHFSRSDKVLVSCGRVIRSVAYHGSDICLQNLLCQ